MNKIKISGNSNKQNKGFTIAEIQVALFIAVIILLAATSLYIFYWRTFIIGNTYLDVYSNSRVAIDRIARDIKWSAEVAANYGGYATSDDTIVLKVPSLNAQGSVITAHYDHVIYRLQGSDLYRIVQIDALSSRKNENRVIARHCKPLTFSSGGVTLSHITYLSTVNTVAVTLPINETMISLSGKGTQTAQLTPTTVIRLRNK